MPPQQPTKTEELIRWARQIHSRCSEYATEWDIPRELVQELGAIVDESEEAYAKNASPSSGCHRTVVAKNEVVGRLRAFMKTLVPTLRANPKIRDYQLELMSIRVREPVKHVKIPVAKKEPWPGISKISERTVRIVVRRPRHKYFSPEPRDLEYHGVLVRYKVGVNGKWIEQHFTRTRIELTLDPLPGVQEYFFSVAWANTKKEAGPWSQEHVLRFY
jgi:hypothetical protein